MAQHLHIEPIGGIAGDMFLGACIDLGVEPGTLVAALAPLKLNVRLSAEPAVRHSIGGTNFHVHDHAHHHRHAPCHPTAHAHHHHTGYRDIMAMIDKIDLADRARTRARAIVTRLAEAEAAVHHTTIDHVHFHEVGAVDSIVDMLGAAVALEALDVDSLSCASLPLGHGEVRCAHGIVPLPAPATVNILRGIPTHGVDRRGETVTPTGAALVAALCERFGPQPPMIVERIGYGAGDRDDDAIANVTRLCLGPRTP